jgi:hypothetical protein
LFVIGAHLADGRLAETTSALALNLLCHHLHQRYTGTRPAPLALIIDEVPG